MAVMMAMAALPIDIMLPALPIFVDTFALADANTAQTIITTYMLGFGLGQIFYGPFSDAWGRKPILMVGLAICSLASLFIIFSNNFTLILVGSVCARVWLCCAANHSHSNYP